MSGGNGHTVILTYTQAPQRVVSLVPSTTESLFDLGAGSSIVGVTDYCPLPAAAETSVPRVGGTKSPDVEAIVALRPDLVVANQEENSQSSVEALEARGMRVWVTFPRTAADAVQILWTLVELFRLPRAAPKVKTLEVTLEWASRAAGSGQAVRVFCPIWAGERGDSSLWWMTFNHETYAHDVLSVAGGINVFAGRPRRYPLEADLGQAAPEEAGSRDTRYPRVSAEEIISTDPEVILLPSEPYAFGSGDTDRIRETLETTRAVRDGRVIAVDGSLLTWHGTRLARALAELPSLLQPVKQ
ncbi:MAG TPA: helical backbone metal receptor [Anaerolineales bacterium]|nr:helical backbone metal receptor [Anaerolineales bacterium]